MVRTGATRCPYCGGDLRFYDTVSRGVKAEYGFKTYISVRRLKCMKCRRVHREIPLSVEPYKRYEKRIIFGLVFGKLSVAQIEYMDFPVKVTIKRWFAFYTTSFIERSV